MNFRKIVEQRPSYIALNTMHPPDIAFLVARFDHASLRPWIEDIARADTHCLDKARYCFTTLSNHYQCSFCLRCGSYHPFFVHTPSVAQKACCQCPNGPLDDHHGNTMMELSFYHRQQ